MDLKYKIFSKVVKELNVAGENVTLEGMFNAYYNGRVIMRYDNSTTQITAKIDYDIFQSYLIKIKIQFYKSIDFTKIKDEIAETIEDTCVVCLVNKRCILNVSCKHLVICGHCCQQLQENRNKCVYCRTEGELSIDFNQRKTN